MRHPVRTRPVRIGAIALAAAFAAAGCSSTSTPAASTGSSTKSTSGSPTGTGSTSGSSPKGSLPPVQITGGGTGTLKVGYSAWPGWFPLAVAEEKGIFKENGLEVELTYFADYVTSIDALVAGQTDINAQTLNDTIFSVASGAKQKIVVVGDNSTGNDQVICDESVKTVADIKGKSVAAEAGVVDHFLLLQGLDKEGLTEKDIDFQNLKTADAAAAFEGGQLDCVAVFAPFTVQASKRPGSHVLFSSKEFPGVIPDHFVASEAAAGRGEDMLKFVTAWYETLAWIEDNQAEALKIMSTKAQVSEDEYKSFDEGTTVFTAEEALSAFEDRAGDQTSLPEMARRINPFLVASGLAKEEADLSGIFAPEFTVAYLQQAGK